MFTGFLQLPELGTEWKRGETDFAQSAYRHLIRGATSGEAGSFGGQLLRFLLLCGPFKRALALLFLLPLCSSHRAPPALCHCFSSGFPLGTTFPRVPVLKGLSCCHGQCWASSKTDQKMLELRLCLININNKHRRAAIADICSRFGRFFLKNKGRKPFFFFFPAAVLIVLESTVASCKQLVLPHGLEKSCELEWKHRLSYWALWGSRHTPEDISVLARLVCKPPKRGAVLC